MPKKNTLPFLLLFIIHTIQLGLSFYKSKNKKQLFILLMSIIGFAYLFEYFVLNIFKAYTYRPKVMKKKYFDNIFGAILSQAIFVPFTAIFLSTSKIGWIGKLAAGGYFYLVEQLFLTLGVYKHNWWKAVYTLFLTPIYFKITDIWKELLREKNRLIQFVSLFLMIMVTEANLLFVFAIFRRIRYGLGKYHSWDEHFIIVPLHAISLSLFTTLSLLKKNSWLAKGRVIVFTFGKFTLFKKIGLVKSKFSMVTILIIRLFVVQLYGLYRDLVYGEDKKEEENQVPE